jgi:hypothetical protein
LLPAFIPYHTVINNTISVDSFALEPFARVSRGGVVPMQHAALAAVFFAAVFGLIYAEVRQRLRAVVVLVLLSFVLVDGLVRTRVESSADFARSLLPAHVDWVDRAMPKPAGDVVLISGAGKTTSALETAYHNQSIDRIYATCTDTLGPDFGEQRLTIDTAGRLRDPSGYVTARYVVVPWSIGVRGRVVAWNAEGAQVLVATPPGPLTVSPSKRIDVYCRKPSAGGT